MDSIDKSALITDEVTEKLEIFDFLERPEILLGKRQASYELDISMIQKRQKVDTPNNFNSNAFYNNQKHSIMQKAAHIAKLYGATLVSSNSLSVSHG